jgi:hypothetical protein
MPLTSEAKKLLSETIRGTAQNPEKGLRARLLRTIHDEADRRYRLSVPVEKAGLDELHRKRRERIESWIAERARASRPKNATERKAVEERLLAHAEKAAAATLLNRLVLLRHLEALGLSKPAVVTGGWNSKGYREFRELGRALCTNGLTDATEGYATLLQLVFDELAIDLPGLFGDVGLTRLFPIPAAMLREVVERLDDRGLASAWTDDTTLGWVYQYWNDPDREALDEKINAGGKIESHEIASKTQMFTERYMVEWLLQNSLGLTWLCMCRKHGWTADAESMLPGLEARRVEWRARREAGTVALDALMPIEGELEDHWKYFVPQPLPNDAVANAPDGVRSLKILDPACGSGHFLVIAFGLLVALYREEARHRGTTVTDREIAESILENNLFGIDIDPRAIQIAAAALYLKARSMAKDARLRKVNLVAPVLQLGNLPADDPAVVLLRRELKEEVGIPEELTNKLLSGLAGVDYLGSLLKVDAAVEKALESVELEFDRSQGQGDLFRGFPAQQVKLTVGEAKATILDKLEMFLSKHSTAGDLGVRLDGEQLAAGVRFVRTAKEGVYDVVVGNPPYQGVGKLRDPAYYVAHYPAGRADLLAGFYLRGLELVRKQGICALITLSNWMFLGGYVDLRKALLRNTTLAIADFGKAAFSTGGTLISTACAVFARGTPQQQAVALQPHAPEEVIRDDGQPARTAAALLLQRGRYEFDPRGFEVIEGEPIVYWWSREFLARYAEAPKLGQVAPARQGLATSDNTRFLRRPWEIRERGTTAGAQWEPFINGAAGLQWFEPLRDVIWWNDGGLQLRAFKRAVLRNPQYNFRLGIAFSMIGSGFSSRAHRFKSVFGHMGSSVFPADIAGILCWMNSSVSRFILRSLNPGVHFEVGDVNRLPVFPVNDSSEIFSVVECAFSEHESHREPSVEFTQPGPTVWRSAQSWAQTAVDREEGAILPPHEFEIEPATPESHLSFAIGLCLGRFGADGEGVLKEASPTALPAGELFLSTEESVESDSLDDPACAPLLESWAKHGASVGQGDDLRTYLRKSFFDYHKKLYENRPIYFPLSSAKKSFVAFVSIHRWKDDTLNVLLADHLVPTKRRLEGELEDLRIARATGSNKAKAEKRFTEVQKLLEELNDFIGKVTEIAEHGPPPPDDKTTRREVDARYQLDLDDGVMVNSAALWPLLEPQWKDPKKWWTELATAQGKKDYDWSHLAARYFPARVRTKCHDDPSLAVAHGCFWTLHPAKAYAWELRLQDEIRPDFSIDEPGSDAARRTFLAEHAREADAIRAAELRRRELKAAKADDESKAGPLFDADAEESSNE